MTEKTKRKGNPRRRTLIRLILLAGIVAAIVSYAVYTLLPDGAEIVFIAPDDNGIDQIWLANLNHPENPQQLTTHNTIAGQVYFDSQNNQILYSVQTVEDPYRNGFWLMNLLTRQTRKLTLSCETDHNCGNYALSPDGRWITYQETILSPNEISFEYKVYLYDISLDTTRVIYNQSYEPTRSIYVNPNPQWVGNTGLLSYRLYNNNADEDVFVLYDVEQNEIVDRITTGLSFFTPTFSEDGLAYAYQTVNPGQCCGFPIIYQSNDFGTSLPGFLHDWHPDNRQILITESHTITEADIESVQYELILMNPITGTQDTLLVIRGELYHQSIHFNAYGSKILYNRMTDESGIHQIMIYDMETREEIALPLSGNHPLWVNGGR